MATATAPLGTAAPPTFTAVAPILVPEMEKCEFAWGTFPEFLSIHCEIDWEAIVFILLVVALALLVTGSILVKTASERFARKERIRILDTIKERISKGKNKDPKCTFGVTYTREIEQEWWRCRTCYGISDMGCCTVCAAKCHKGHDLELSPAAHHLERRFCSCGSSGRCRQNDDKDQELVSKLKAYYEQSDSDSKLPDIESVRFHWHTGVDGAFLSSYFTSSRGEEDFRIFEYSIYKEAIVAMGGSGTGQKEETVEQAVVAEWDRVYNTIDVDGDGVLSAKEIQRYFQKNKQLQERLSVKDQKSFEALLQRLDADGDGVVDRAEFALLVEELGLAAKFPSMLEVAVNWAQDLIAADAMGTSDPYVVLEVTGLTKKTESVTTSKKQKTLNPVWNERYRFDLANGAVVVLRFTVYDHDKMGQPDFLGYAETTFTPNDLHELLKESREISLRLRGRPNNPDDEMLVKRHKNNIGTLFITVRTSATQNQQEGGKARRKYGETGRTNCAECRRKLFFIPKVIETKQWKDSRDKLHRLKRLPRCKCGFDLLPDGWRDELRTTFEPYRHRLSTTSVVLEPLYPIADHVMAYRMLGWWVKVAAGALNAWSIIEGWRRRPVRDPGVDLNLATLSLVWGELFLVIAVVIHLIWAAFGSNAVGVRGMVCMAADDILGAHSFRLIPIGWFPQRWLHAFRRMDQRSSPSNTRHALARVGLWVAAIGCTMFFLPLPFYCIAAKLAFLRYIFHVDGAAGQWSDSLSFSDVILAANVANNVRNVIDVINVPPSEHRLPFMLWLALVQKLTGPPNEKLRTFLSLVTFSPTERSLPLLYEVFVLNHDSIIVREKEREKGDESKDEMEMAMTVFGELTGELSAPLLEDKEKSQTVTLTNEPGWLKEASEKLQQEVSRIELELIEERQKNQRLERELEEALWKLKMEASPLQG
eukprot:Sspe_Gene.4546::Locus_1490_Transcript_2_3_Confidence_0.400_Length_2895::g.4546::m.4546